MSTLHRNPPFYAAPNVNPWATPGRGTIVVHDQESEWTLPHNAGRSPGPRPWPPHQAARQPSRTWRPPNTGQGHQTHRQAPHRRVLSHMKPRPPGSGPWGDRQHTYDDPGGHRAATEGLLHTYHLLWEPYQLPHLGALRRPQWSCTALVGADRRLHEAQDRATAQRRLRAAERWYKMEATKTKRAEVRATADLDLTDLLVGFGPIEGEGEYHWCDPLTGEVFAAVQAAAGPNSDLYEACPNLGEYLEFWWRLHVRDGAQEPTVGQFIWDVISRQRWQRDPRYGDVVDHADPEQGSADQAEWFEAFAKRLLGLLRVVEWRVTRHFPYTANCPGLLDPSSRQGHYLRARTPEFALNQLLDNNDDYCRNFEYTSWGGVAESWSDGYNRFAAIYLNGHKWLRVVAKHHEDGHVQPAPYQSQSHVR